MSVRTPAVAVDVIIELLDTDGRPIVLVERANTPAGWAIPGGFVDVGETVAAAARREAREETGLEVELACLLGVYSDPARDPRGHAVSVVYVGHAHGEPHAASDALAARAYAFTGLPSPLAFDHARILGDYRRWRELGVFPPPA